jgi:hypothetical protein
MRHRSHRPAHGPRSHPPASQPHRVPSARQAARRVRRRATRRRTRSRWPTARAHAAASAWLTIFRDMGHLGLATQRSPTSRLAKGKVRAPADRFKQHRRSAEITYWGNWLRSVCRPDPHLTSSALSDEIRSPDADRSSSLPKRTLTLQPPGKGRASVPPFQFTTKPAKSESNPLTRSGLPLIFAPRPNLSQWSRLRRSSDSSSPCAAR